MDVMSGPWPFPSLHGLPAVRPCRSCGAFRVIGLQWLLVQFTGGRHWPNLQDGISARTPVVTSTAPDRVSWRPKSWTLSAYGADCHGRLCFGDAHRILTLARPQHVVFFLSMLSFHLFFSSLLSLSRCFSLPFHLLLLQNFSCNIGTTSFRVSFQSRLVTTTGTHWLTTFG